MRSLPAAPLLALALAACAAGVPGPRAGPARESGAKVGSGTLAAAPDGGYETGRLTSPAQGVAGPFVLTYLAPGAELLIANTVAGSGGASIGAIAGPLAQPFHLAPGLELRLAAPGGAVYAGYRVLSMTRPLASYVGRQIWVGLPGAQPEQWWLREVGGDHLTLERSRTYRVIPLRRVVEISWTDLTGIDPTPRVVVGPQ